ncbi:MAG TPA: hypothetical protein VFF46_14450 [Kribbella sp.]|nr:hypothetical protein [Kribbella sp.]
MKAAVRRLARMLLDFEGALTRRIARRPGRSQRLVALSVFLFSLYGLTGAERWPQRLLIALVCLLSVLVAVAPRSLYDDRPEAWSKTRVVVSRLSALVLLAAGGFVVVSAIVDGWTFVQTILIGVAILVALSNLLARRRARAAEYLPSATSNDPLAGSRMGQFNRYVESYHPALLHRVIQVIVPLAWIVNAVVHPTFENMLWAVLLASIMLPYGIAPEAVKRRVSRWERDHPIQSGVFIHLTMLCGFFLLLRWFLNRPHSIFIAVALTLVLFATSKLLRHRTAGK